MPALILLLFIILPRHPTGYSCLPSVVFLHCGGLQPFLAFNDLDSFEICMTNINSKSIS